jgi:hypothetical protein
VRTTLEFRREVSVSTALTLPVDADVQLSCEAGKVAFQTIGPRTLVALRYR